MAFRGRQPKPRLILKVRPITRADLELLSQPRDYGSAEIKKIRNSHHTVAMLSASGLTNKQVAERTGYTPTRVGALLKSPAMQSLVAEYQQKITAQFIASNDEYLSLATSNMLAAERHIADRIGELDDAEELLSVRDALSISRDAADRFGYGKHKTQTNLNVDFAKELEKALARSKRVSDPKLIEAKASTSTPVMEVLSAPQHSPSRETAVEPIPFVRRA